MTPAGNDGWKRSAPARFVVWLVAFVFYGRVRYNNTLHDVRQLTVGHVVVRLLSLGIALAFVYWNVFVVVPKLALFIWTMVGLGVVSLLAWMTIMEAGIDAVDVTDPLNRRKHHTAEDQRAATGDRTRFLRRTGSVLDDTPDDD